MEISDQKKREFIQKLIVARIRLLCDHGFYGLLLMHMNFALDETLPTAATDGEKILFNPDFLDSLSNSELDFVLMHEVMHVALKHCIRGEGLDAELFNIACDIVINSIIKQSKNNDIKSISLNGIGAVMHKAPNGKEGHNYTAEEVYQMLISKGNKKSTKSGGNNASGQGDGDNDSDSNGDNNGSNDNGKNSKSGANNNGKYSKNNSKNGSGSYGDDLTSNFDDHGRWKKQEDVANEFSATWDKRIADAVKAVELRNSSTGCGDVPEFAKRILKDLKNPQTDWREILQNFVQEDIVDYSFCPPDRRYDGDFFLPDFNEKDDKVEKILFMIDTSASMSDHLVALAYTEVKGAIDQFNGKLEGWLGFFDAGIVEPKPFDSEESFSVIEAEGGGGTNFHCIFKYVKDYMISEPPASIIILTDGYAPFPDESDSMGIPVLWVINNEAVTPPFGKIARIKQ